MKSSYDVSSNYYVYSICAVLGVSSINYNNDNDDDGFSSCTGSPSYTSNTPLGCSALNAGAGVFYTSKQCTSAAVPTRNPTKLPGRHSTKVYTAGYVTATSYSDFACASVVNSVVFKLGKCIVAPFVESPRIYTEFQVSSSFGEIFYKYRANIYADDLCTNIVDTVVVPSSSSCITQQMLTYSTSKPIMPPFQGVAQRYDIAFL